MVKPDTQSPALPPTWKCACTECNRKVSSCGAPELLVGSVTASLTVVAPLSWVTMVGSPAWMKAMAGWLV